MEFITNRFTIRKLKADDFDAFYEMQSDPNVMRFIKPPLNEEEAKKELKKFIGYYTSKGRFFLLWAIEAKKDASFVGLCVYIEIKATKMKLLFD